MLKNESRPICLTLPKKCKMTINLNISWKIIGEYICKTLHGWGLCGGVWKQSPVAQKITPAKRTTATYRQQLLGYPPLFSSCLLLLWRPSCRSATYVWERLGPTCVLRLGAPMNFFINHFIHLQVKWYSPFPVSAPQNFTSHAPPLCLYEDAPTSIQASLL